MSAGPPSPVFEPPKKRLAVLILVVTTSPLFYKKGTTHKTSILQKTQEGDAVSHFTNAMRGKKLSPILVILEDTVVIFLHNTEDH
jgi:hypothetical protein